MTLREELTGSDDLRPDLAEGEAQLQLIFDQAPVGICLVGLDKRFLKCNAEFCSFLGYSEEELKHRTITEVTLPEDVAIGMADLKAIVAGEKETSRVEKRYLRKDGTVVWGDVRINLVRDGQGRPLYFLPFILDITEHKLAEVALRDGEQKYRALFEASSDAIMTLAPPSWRFTTGNPATIRMFRVRDVEEFVSRAPWEFSPAQQPDGRDSGVKAGEMIARAMTEGSHLFEWTHQRADGETFPATVLLSRMETAGQAFLQATVRDISELKRAQQRRAELEEKLRVSQKMEAIGQLAGGVAHDFNNMLAVILNYSSLVLEALGEEHPARADLLEVQQSGQRAAALTHQLLAFGRKQLMQPVALDLNAVVGEMESMLRRLIGENIALNKQLAPDLGLVKADPSQLEQVIMNLVINARDAMPGGGALTIETANVDLDEAYAERHVGVRPGPHVMFAVSDTGCGMSSEVKQRLFEPFFTTKGQGKGTGLGLPTVYGIVKQSGGAIWVYSEPGQGSTFKIYLPRELHATVAAAPSKPLGKAAGGSETVLVVEDEPAVCRVAKRILRTAGYSVLTAAGGPEALQTAAAHDGDIHLVLTDVVMPGMSGRVFFEQFAKIRPTSRVLYMSGYTDDAIVQHGMLDAGTAFISKPFNADDLGRKVREVLDAGGVDGSGANE
ncbi:MAG: PAS domain S-box protein [Pseudomonadota bacterium]